MLSVAFAVSLLYVTARLAQFEESVGSIVRIDVPAGVLADVYEPDPPADADADELMAVMARDKKAVNGLTFVLDGPDGVQVVADVDPDLARVTLEHLR